MDDRKLIEKKENNIIKNKNESKINNIKSISKNLFNKSPSDKQITNCKRNQLNKKEEEYEKIKKR